ncbi:MAG: XRE family transcriptional regulator [Selenomonadales bacterium]|mgnify:FL=1|jgi:transcriptional regulator with XRE-family HTH domain|nr:helix-turn-helix transcriptional regulator [Clostridiales bacterium]PWL98879.1 MAG: XRE family transcriptional regulator [Selenomonadales bacterium]DAU21626.1 MAG TPA: repressor protein [Caudoviricetes sp.]
MTFSERLLQLRKEKNITQKQLASALNLSEVGIQNYEGGRRKPAYDILIALADYFNVSLDYLVGRSDVPERR